MATAALLRSIRRREVASAPFSPYIFLSSSGKTSLNSSYIGQNFTSLARAFSWLSSKPAGSGIDLGTTTTTTKNPKQVIENAQGARTTPSVVALDVGTSTKRLFSTMSVGINTTTTTHEETKTKSFRPLSPHLPVYQPQMNSMLSIFNRISGVYLTGVTFAGYLLYLKMGMICLTYPSFYQVLYHTQQQLPVITSVTALAAVYHTVKSTHSLLTH